MKLSIPIRTGKKLDLTFPDIPTSESSPFVVTHSRRKLDVTCLVTPDVVGLGLPSDNNFQPITSLVSIAILGNEIVVGVTFLRNDGKHVTCCL